MARHWTRHPVIAGVIGLFAGALSIALVEWAAGQWLGPADITHPTLIPPAKFAAVLVAWVLGAGTAALVGTAWCGGRTPLPGLIPAGVLLAGSVATMLTIPHPTWVVVGAVVLMPAAAWLGARSRRAHAG